MVHNKLPPVVRYVTIKPREEPLIVRGCDISVAADGITITGPPDSSDSESPTGGIAVRNNHIHKALRGVYLIGWADGIHITGNLIRNGSQAGICLEDVDQRTQHILFANNTVVQNSSGLRVWMNQSRGLIREHQVSLIGNLFLESSNGDLLAMRGTDRGSGAPSLELGREVLANWLFHRNWRDRSGVAVRQLIPKAAGDRIANEFQFLSRSPDEPDFMRPTKDSPFITGGAGGDLPMYAGAVPPQGTKPWDWNVTWRSRMMRRKYRNTESSSQDKKP